jgi:dTDP-4-amino-4,6-dideoxygalactose transaminase
MINVTKPFLPPRKEYDLYLDGIWERNWLTNNGPLVNDLELKLKDYLDLKHLLFVSNGTIALQIAIKAMELSGEIITTPFSYVATTSSIVWENCTPIFVDIDKNSFNIDASKIENSITEKTSAILATHVFGNPCNIDAIEAIAQKHELKIIYDAAHCFGSKYKGKSVMEYGDISTLSFHATKLYHTTEGGAVVSPKPELIEKMAFLRNFGHDGPDKFKSIGINGKNSEFHAAMGLANLKYADDIIKKRMDDHAIYNKWLNPLKLQTQFISKDVDFNHAYYPVVFNTEDDCKLILKELANREIYARRYFYPVLSSLNYVKKQSTPIADDISKRILCLPLYYQLNETEINMICRVILRYLNKEQG